MIILRARDHCRGIIISAVRLLVPDQMKKIQQAEKKEKD
jgi:hypothetical protein